MLCSLRLDFVFKLHVKTVVVCKGKEGFSYSISFFLILLAQQSATRQNRQKKCEGQKESLQKQQI